MSNQISVSPSFLKGCKGQLFTLYFPPKGDVCRGALLHVPAFAEEMNKSRHIVAKQARELSKQGYGILVFDYYGTGDSDGMFEDATWEIWQKDVLVLVDWLSENVSKNIILWGLRFGCLLALKCANLNKDILQLLFWQPVINGEQHMQHFLRLRLAASLMGVESKETTKLLKSILLNGESLEVSGYSLSSLLYRGITKEKMTTIQIETVKKILWYEVSSTPKPLSIPCQNLIDDWKKLHEIDISFESIKGKQFWSNQEIVQSNKLISQTSASLICKTLSG